MAEYKLNIYMRSARPRSKRLREAGGTESGSAGGAELVTGVWHTGNSNLPTVDWTAKDMIVAGVLKVGSITISEDNGKLKIDKELYSTEGITAFADGTTEGGSGSGGIGYSELERYLTDNNYTTTIWVNAQGFLKEITKAMIEAVLTGNITSHTHDSKLNASIFETHITSDLHLTDSQRRVLSLLSIENGKLKISADVFSVGGMSAYGDGTGGSGGGIGYLELQEYLDNNDYLNESAANLLYLSLQTGGVISGSIEINGGALIVEGMNVKTEIEALKGIDSVTYTYQNKTAAEKEQANFNIGNEAWKSGYTKTELDTLESNWYCAGNTSFANTETDEMIRYIHSGHTDSNNQRHVGQIWFNGEDIRYRNKIGSGAWSSIKSCIVKYCGGRLAADETDRVIATPSGKGSWIDSETYGIILQYAAGQIGYGATVHQAIFTPSGFMTRKNIGPNAGQTTGWSDWVPLFSDATTEEKGLVQLASNSGDSTDAGKVPACGEDGKLSSDLLPEILPELSELSRVFGASGIVNIGENGKWYNVYTLLISSGASVTVDVNMPENIGAGAPSTMTFDLIFAGVGAMSYNFKQGDTILRAITETLTGSSKNRTFLAVIGSNLKYKVFEMAN